MIQFVAGFEDDMVMPQEGERFSPEAIGLLRAWNDEGANNTKAGFAKNCLPARRLVERGGRTSALMGSAPVAREKV